VDFKNVPLCGTPIPPQGGIKNSVPNLYFITKTLAIWTRSENFGSPFR
jgi:hypothetical protein